jgi:hypothetical protein
MDAKQTAMLRDLHAQIVAGDFGESEVGQLLSLMRQDSPRRSVLKELGDFTHRRRKEGQVQEYMRTVKDFVDNFGKRAGTLQTNLVFTETRIAEELDAGLARHGLPPFSRERDPSLVPTAQARSRQVQLVMLATLQHVALIYGGVEFGRLELWVVPHAFQLMGVVIADAGRGPVQVAAPALEVGNDFCPVPPPDPHIRPEGVWRVLVEGGHTRLHGLW